MKIRHCKHISISSPPDHMTTVNSYNLALMLPQSSLTHHHVADLMIGSNRIYYRWYKHLRSLHQCFSTKSRNAGIPSISSFPDPNTKSSGDFSLHPALKISKAYAKIIANGCNTPGHMTGAMQSPSPIIRRVLHDFPLSNQKLVLQIQIASRGTCNPLETALYFLAPVLQFTWREIGQEADYMIQSSTTNCSFGAGRIILVRDLHFVTKCKSHPSQCYKRPCPCPSSPPPPPFPSLTASSIIR